MPTYPQVSGMGFEYVFFVLGSQPSDTFVDLSVLARLFHQIESFLVGEFRGEAVVAYRDPRTRRRSSSYAGQIIYSIILLNS